ncbi:MAG: NAD-dependent epimerase/dehydratase family protein [Trueperaceae bacterium]
MNVLVTGGAGYIGSITVEVLLARRHRVVVLDDLSTGHRDAVPEGAAFVHGDVADPDMVAQAVTDHEVDSVLHFAAASLVAESMAHPTKYFRNNTAGSLVLLDTLERLEVRRFVLSSTAAVYGTPAAVPIPEDAVLSPESVYGESKLMIERALAWLARTAGFGTVALRYFNAAGASAERGEDHRPESHLVPLVLGRRRQARRDRDLRRRLPDARWHRRARLRARSGPGRGARAGARGATTGTGRNLQPRHRAGVQRVRGHRCLCPRDG